MVFDKGLMTSREKFMLHPEVYLSEEDAIKDLKEYDEILEEYEIIPICREDTKKKRKKVHGIENTPSELEI